MHGDRPKVGREHRAYKGFIAGMDDHLLIKVADMLHGISPSIIYGERWLEKLVREPSLINPPDKKGLRNLL